MSEYVDWVASTVGVFDAYAVQIGLDLLVGDEERRNGARKMLRLGGSEPPDELADRCWAAAWHLFFLRVIEGGTFGLYGTEELPAVPTFLITANRDPAFVRAQTEIHSISRVPGRPMPNVYVDISWSQHPVASKAGLDAVLDRRTREPGRHLRQAEALVDGAVAATKSAESLLGIERSALFGSPWSS
jgi:hypothetical protein